MCTYDGGEGGWKSQDTADRCIVTRSNMKWAGQATSMEVRSGEYKILIGKPQGKRELGEPSRRMVKNIRMYLKETGWEGVDRIDLVQDTDKWWKFFHTGSVK